jgi:hypothetical protein
MYDAKPRMLTNLHWIDTRDDIRLIRSIKFGVPGTAMTPWGDMTSSLQRIQLVIFIRSLSMTQEQRDNLRNQVFEAFDVARQTIDVARIDEYTKINEIEDRLKELNDKRAYMMQKIAQGEAQANEAVPIYQEELKLTQSLKEHEKQDQLLEEITSLVKKQSENFQIMGVHLIMSTMLGEPFDHFLKIIELNKKIYQVQDGNLKAAFDPEKEKEMEKLQNKLLANIDRKMKEDEREREILQGKLPSEETKAELKKVEADLKAYQKLKNTLMSGFVEALTLRDEQKELYKNYEAEKGRI